MTDVTTVADWCTQRGEKFTPTRRAVFELMAKQDQALTAYQLLERLQEDMPHAKPPTIYRALEFLQRMGMVHRIDSKNAFVLCDAFPHHHESAFLVCQQCGNVSEITMDHMMEQIMASSQGQGFTPHHATVEIRGLCKLCQN